MYKLNQTPFKNASIQLCIASCFIFHSTNLIFKIGFTFLKFILEAISVCGACMQRCENVLSNNNLTVQ